MVAVTTTDPHDTHPAAQALVAGHGAFSIDPRAASGTGWRVVPSGTSAGVQSDLYVVDPGPVDRTVVVLPGQTREGGLGITGQPSHRLVNVSAQINVFATDQYYNTVTSASGAVSLAVTCATYCQGASPGSVVPGSQALSGGTASFTHVPDTLGKWQATPSGGPGTNTASPAFVVAGRITTFAGNGQLGFSGDGGAATSARFTLPIDVVVDGAGNTYVADSGNNRVRKITPGGTISTYAGGGSGCAAQTNSVGDNCPATQAILSAVTGLAVDSSGRLYISDQLHHRVRRVETDGKIITFAGTGASGYSGDGGLATSAALNYPFGLGFDGAGTLYIADASNHVIRGVTPGGTISTVAGDGFAGYTGDGIVASFARLNFPTDVAFKSNGDMYIADSGNHAIRIVDGGTQVMDTFIGTNNFGSGVPGYGGDDGPASSALLSSPFSVLVDGQDRLLIADSGNQRIRFVNGSGIITTVAGSGTPGYGGDSGPATAAMIDVPMGLGLRANGELLIADMNNHRVRRLETVAAGPAPTPTPTALPTATATPTPVPDADGDTLPDALEPTYGTNPADPDTDDDGCADGEEVGLNPELGGLRDPLNFWDLYDAPNEAGSRDQAVDLFTDIFGVALRYGANDAGGTAAVNRNSNPLTVPPAAPAYHPAFDRSAPAPGGEAWDLGPPDGSIDLLTDVFAVAAQFGHSCASPP
jgi:hypothetical protein